MTECFGVEFRPAALSLACSHPDIESFFDMYLDDAAGAPFLAVRVSHEFMESVRARRPFALRYPVEESVPGVRQEEGERSAVVLKEIDASMLWPLLIMAIAVKFYYAANLLTRARIRLLEQDLRKGWVQNVVRERKI